MEKVKDIDWKVKSYDLYEKLKPYAKKGGRIDSIGQTVPLYRSNRYRENHKQFSSVA